MVARTSGVVVVRRNDLLPPQFFLSVTIKFQLAGIYLRKDDFSYDKTL